MGLISQNGGLDIQMKETLQETYQNAGILTVITYLEGNRVKLKQKE